MNRGTVSDLYVELLSKLPTWLSGILNNHKDKWFLAGGSVLNIELLQSINYANDIDIFVLDGELYYKISTELNIQITDDKSHNTRNYDGHYFSTYGCGFTHNSQLSVNNLRGLQVQINNNLINKHTDYSKALLEVIDNFDLSYSQVIYYKDTILNRGLLDKSLKILKIGETTINRYDKYCMRYSLPVSDKQLITTYQSMLSENFEFYNTRYIDNTIYNKHKDSPEHAKKEHTQSRICKILEDTLTHEIVFPGEKYNIYYVINIVLQYHYENNSLKYIVKMIFKELMKSFYYGATYLHITPIKYPYICLLLYLVKNIDKNPLISDKMKKVISDNFPEHLY